AQGAVGVKITYYSSTSAYANHIRLRNCEIRNTPDDGVLITSDQAHGKNTDYNEFIGDSVHDDGYNSESLAGSTQMGCGFYVYSNNNLIDGDNVYHNAAEGVQIWDDNAVNGKDCSRNIIRNSQWHDNGGGGGNDDSGQGILVAFGDSNQVYNNLV